jgi:hypothetical protein
MESLCHKGTTPLLPVLFGAPRAPVHRFTLLGPYVLQLPAFPLLQALPRTPAFVRLPAALLFGDQVSLELLHRAARFADKPADVSGHAGELVGTEDDQKEEPYDHHLRGTDSEHEA